MLRAVHAWPDAIGWSIANRLAPIALAGLAMVGCGDNTAPDHILPEATYAALCAMPRTGTDPSTGEPYLDVAGSVRDENLWLRSWIDDLYLWYREVPRIDVDSYADPVSYFDHLKTPAKTRTGKDKDSS